MGRGGRHDGLVEWPRPGLRWVPERHGAVEIALEIRRQTLGLADEQPLVDLDAAARAGNFRISLADLGSDRGGSEAMMFPDRCGALEIRVDPRPRGGWTDGNEPLRQQVAHQRARFRVAHEMAHSLFYERTGHSARRHRHWSQAEEDFCDRFAAALLVPPAAVRKLPSEAASIIALHQEFDVSVELAARAYATEHPDVAVVVGFWAASEKPSQVTVQWSSVSKQRAETALEDATTEQDMWQKLSLARLPAPRRQLIAVGALSAAS
jgi:hypothetical protein